VARELSDHPPQRSTVSRRVNPDSPSDIRSALEEMSIGLKKRWGQNFLVNRGARERLVDLLGLRPGEATWEIGPGLGSMTGLLLERGARLVAFEVDRGLCRYLRAAFEGEARFSLVEGDFMRTWEPALAAHGAPARLLGNLPYRSASLMIAAIVESGLRPAAIVFTVQRELAERMTAQPRTKSYSSFSALCQACFTITARGDLKPGSFFPSPEVVSTAIELRPRPGGPDTATVRFLSGLLRALFAARRKTLRNNLLAARLPDGTSAARVAAALEGEGISEGSRAEEIPPEVFVRLARQLSGETSRGNPTGPSSP
jgi:16S rRNA (adenine1518-N6/adenine1519-N6)-dimethyltransferase